MKNILKLSLVSLCASGAIFAAQANNSESASKNESDKQLVITEPAGAETQKSVTTWQTVATIPSSPSSVIVYEPSGAAILAPRMVTGREQDCYADCILHQYQKGKGAARATDEHYWNNISSDRLYAQYPASSVMYQNVAATSYQPTTWTSSTWSGSGLWYGPDGKIYNSAASLTPINSGSIRESAGAEQSSATQSGTSGAQSSTELKSSQSQPGTANQENAQTEPTGTSTSSSTTSDTSAQPSSTSTAPSTPESTQSSTSSSTASQGVSEKVSSTLKSDSTLSPLASNVTVQDQNGKVALNGTVKSEAEKQQIVSKAEEIAGSGNVIDNLQVKPDNSNP